MTRISPVLQRVGWMQDFAGWRKKTDALNDALRRQTLVWRILQPGGQGGSERDDRWKIVVNCAVEPDIEPANENDSGERA